MAHEDANLLEMVNITKEFPGVKALDSVNLAVRRGEIHAICGENGAGKSTLMKVLSGVYPAGTYTGDIRYDGSVRRFSGINASEEAGIAIIHQELALIPELSITENIFLGNEITSMGRIDWDEARRRTNELLQRVQLREDPDTPIKYLGVGKQQLVEIAKALEKDVKLLILDEPTAALNEHDSQQLLSIITGLREQGMTSIMISHKLAEIEQISDSITIIRDGKSIETLQRRRHGRRGPHNPRHGRTHTRQPIPREVVADWRRHVRSPRLDGAAPARHDQARCEELQLQGSRR